MITDPQVRQLLRYLRTLEKRVGEVDQRVARVVMTGKVLKVRAAGDDWQVKMEIGRDPETDKVVESPWVLVQPLGAGALKIKAKPTQGEQMRLLSPSGVVGSGSIAIRAAYDDDHPAPKGDEDLVVVIGKSTLRIKDGLIVAKVGDNEIELTGDGANVVVKNGHGHVVGKWHLGVEAKDEKASAPVSTEAGPAKQVTAKV